MAVTPGKAQSFATDKTGAFVRRDAGFKDWIKADPQSKFPAAKDRYHLYVSYACPWANRTLILRNMKGLQDVISFDVVGYTMHKGETRGWNFDKEEDSTGDSLYGCKLASELYEMAGYTFGPQSVPILWDKETKTIVNNESSEIIRMLNSEFNDFCATEEQRNLDLYPESLRGEIDSVNEWVYPMINNGVYRSGFATTQVAYEDACTSVFTALEKVEGILSKSRYITGNQLTEADVRLFVTLVRFDPVYHVHFKCSKKRIVDYPNTWAYTREMYQMAAVRPTIFVEYIKNHYFKSHTGINPYRIVAMSSDLYNLEVPHGRDIQFSS